VWKPYRHYRFKPFAAELIAGKADAAQRLHQDTLPDIWVGTATSCRGSNVIGFTIKQANRILARVAANLAKLIQNIWFYRL